MREDQTKSSNKRWLVIAAGVAVVLLGIILQWAVAARRDAAERLRFGEENLVKLKPGMTLNELEEILGPNHTASTCFEYQLASSHDRAWDRAVKEGKFRRWRSRLGYDIEVAFSGDPSTDSKAVVIKIHRPSRPGFEQRPRDMWMAAKDNFLKLKVGMTLAELEDIIGVGEPARSIENAMVGAWETAVKEYRVYRWASRGPEYPAIPTCPVIVACFTSPPSASPAAKVVALSFRDGGTWDEDRGTLAGAQAGKDQKN